MVLGEHLHRVVGQRPSVKQRLHIGEQRLLLVLHVASYLVCILVIEAQHQLSQRIILADALLQFPADIRQLKVKIVAVTGFQIVQQGRHADALVVVADGLPIDGIVHHRQKGVAVDPIQFTRLFHRLVAKAQIDAEAAQGLQHAVVILDERNHPVLWLIHLHILHTYLYILVLQK